MRLLAVDVVIQLCRTRPTVAILAPRGQPFAFSFFLGFRAHFFFRGVGCQVTSCTQSRLLRAELFVLKFLKFDKILQILRQCHLQFFAEIKSEISRKLLFFQTDFLRKF